MHGYVTDDSTDFPAGSLEGSQLGPSSWSIVDRTDRIRRRHR